MLKNIGVKIGNLKYKNSRHLEVKIGKISPNFGQIPLIFGKISQIFANFSAPPLSARAHFGHQGAPQIWGNLGAPC